MTVTIPALRSTRNDMPNLFDLTGKVAIVTGSTKGIGRAIVEQMARHGARVVVSSRKADVCDRVTAELKAAGLAAIAIPCNVGIKAECEALIDRTVAAFGGLDILVCNAATNPYYGPLGGMSDEAYDKIMITNVKGSFWLCNKAAPLIASRGGGSIILLSSIAGFRGNNVIGIYGVSKAAEAQLARNLAVEWGPKKVRVNAIAPGLIKTDFARALWEDPKRLAVVEEKTPLRRIGEPDDIAGVAVMLAAPAGAYLTGQMIVVDGGETVAG
jgi:NAD(P)-dependent dehydrogenase (short-subunit alcohol dehydrogenase family)